jgi:two-component system chemotaxis response regulator CheY
VRAGPGPARAAAASAAAGDVTARGDARPTSKREEHMAGRVMICDDAMFMRCVIGGALREAGYEIVAEAASGQDAVAQYQASRPDLVTMDVVMPDVSGLEAVARIRAVDPRARILMVSAVGQEALVRKAMEAGAAGFVSKPFTKDELVARVADVITVRPPAAAAAAAS